MDVGEAPERTAFSDAWDAQIESNELLLLQRHILSALQQGEAHDLLIANILCPKNCSMPANVPLHVCLVSVKSSLS